MSQDPTPATSPARRIAPLAVQYLRFGAVGVAATLTHVGLFAALIEFGGMAPLLANLVAFAVAVGVSFAGHYLWTFVEDRPGPGRWRATRAMGRFLVVALVGLALNSLVVYLVVHALALPYGYAILVMVSAVPVVLFLLNKFWAFR
ncbi:MAG TPA: GtrA family protein [Alphaproteobacteria bacterium]|jgi:putative flippase GtrA